MATPFGTLGNIPTLTVDGRVFTDLTTLIKLYTHNTTAGRYGTCRKQNGTGTGYAAVGTLTVSAIRVNQQTAGGSSVKMISSENDSTFDSSTAPSGSPLYYGNMNTTHFFISAGAGTTVSYAVDFNVTVGRYLTFDNVTNADQAIHAWGYDV